VTAVDAAPPPCDVEAERAVLGALLLRPAALTEVDLTGAEFYQPRHQQIWAAIGALTGRGEPVDVVSVGAELMATGMIGRVGGHPYLHDLTSAVDTTVNVGWHAGIVAEQATRRRFLELAARIEQRATGPSAFGAAEAREALRDLMAPLSVEFELLVEERDGAQPVTDVPTLDEFLARPRRPENWVIPGLLARDDVVMFLGAEGSGKGWVSRQIAQCLHAGVHPFKPHVRIPPMSVLLVDLEVSEETLLDEMTPMSHQVARLGDWGSGSAHVWHHLGGLNLRKPADAREFERRVEHARPDVVLIGSLYNTFALGSDSHEHAADDVSKVFNGVRARNRCALWIEAHMPKGDGVHRPATPYGSSVWMRWATHGLVMSHVDGAVYGLDRFRPDRGVREFPAGLRRGGELPVTAIFDGEEIRQLRAQVKAARA